MENINFLRPGTILKGEQSYRIESVLGAGGFGITYLAQTSVMFGNIPVNVRVAVKEHFVGDYCERQHDGATVVCVGTQKVRDMVERSLKDFLSEARRLSAVSAKHPNIVKVNEIIEANGTAYYVMEYLSGKSLWDYIRERGPLTEEETRSLMLPIVDASAYLHASDMTHLDIKPQNIMLTDDNGTLKPVLIDFGLSKHYTPDGSPTSTVNTLACSDGYSPIEQYSGITTFSPAADVYALGATILTCLTGRIPTVSTNWPLGEPSRTIDALPISEDLKEILKKSMSPAAHGRYKDGSVMLRALASSKYADTISLPDETKETQQRPVSKHEQSIPEYQEEKKLGDNDVPEKTGRNWEKIIPVSVFIILFLIIFGALFARSGADDSGSEIVQTPQMDTFWMFHSDPVNLDLAVRRLDGNTYYLNTTEWAELSLDRKSGLEKLGVVIIENGERFILSLNRTEPMMWNEAMRNHVNQMPNKAQAKAIGSQYDAINSAIFLYGGDVTFDYNFYWTKSENDSSTAWIVSMNDGTVNSSSKANIGRVRAIMPLPAAPTI